MDSEMGRRLGIRRVAMSILAASSLAMMLACPQSEELISQVTPEAGNYKRALKHGLETIPVARQFQSLFPNAQNFYTYYNGQSTILRCQAALYQRYELNLSVKVSLDINRTKVTRFEKPEFYLYEIESVVPSSGGTVSISTGNLHKRFGLKEWQKLYEATGDFSVLGIVLIKDKPVPNFTTYWKEHGDKLRM